MSDIESGGPAFPGSYAGQHGEIRWSGGMTKREWFAGMALNAVYQRYLKYSDQHGRVENWRDGVAGDALDMADAMLRARGIA